MPLKELCLMDEHILACIVEDAVALEAMTLPTLLLILLCGWSAEARP